MKLRVQVRVRLGLKVSARVRVKGCVRICVEVWVGYLHQLRDQCLGEGAEPLAVAHHNGQVRGLQTAWWVSGRVRVRAIRRVINLVRIRF